MLRRRSRTIAPDGPSGLTRRNFLRNSGLTGLALAGAAGVSGRVREAEAQARGAAPEIVRRKTVCPFCSVGCSIWAEVENGVWTGQEPVFESPINQGTHCAKGAAMRELGLGERRLKYPMKKVNGEWVRASWDEAIQDISSKLLQYREESGPDSVYWLGSAKWFNEQAYMFRKFAAMWGTNNVDHQARICHSTTVAGVANIYGYGAMTNTFNDIRNAKSIFIIGGNPAEAHPVSMLHILNAKENGAKVIVADPRFTRTAAHADEYVRIRPGTDVAFLFGLLRVILENGWQDQEFIDQRVWGLDKAQEEIDHWTLEEVERVTGIPGEQVERCARMMAENRPGTLIWCMGLTQSSIGNNKTRAACMLSLALGNIGKEGGGSNIFRGHDNVQGATDMGVTVDSLPAYYGLDEGAWRHFARCWDVEYDWLVSRFGSRELMEAPGIPVSRWYDGALEPTENLDQPNPIRAMIYWGHASNSLTRGPDVKAGLDKVDLLVIIDPHPTQTAVMPDRPDGIWVLPAATTAEAEGSVTNSNRSLQWRQKVIDPIFESKTDYEITYLLANALGFGEQLFKTYEIENNQPTPESILREINRSTWTIGYTGQSPERLKLHMEHQDKFDGVTLRGMSGPVEGDYYCLPWPAWGAPELNHPGSPILYRTDIPVAEGGSGFRARWGVEHEGEILLAEDSSPQGSSIEDGYPEITVGMLAALGLTEQLTAKERLIITAIAGGVFNLGLLDVAESEAEGLIDDIERQAGRAGDPTESVEDVSADTIGSWQTNAEAEVETDQAEGSVRARFPDYAEEALAAIRGYLGRPQPEGQPAPEPTLRDKIMQVNWKTDISGGLQRVAVQNGLAPFGNGKARTYVWNFPDAVPIHREPLYTNRRDLLPQYGTYDDRRMMRLPVLYRSIQEVDHSQEFPLALTSGRLVEYEGGGDETRSIPWLAEFQQQMFAEINPADAAAAGVADGEMCWVNGPEGRIRVKALVTPRVGPGVVFMPYHFAGMWQGESLADRYPEGTVPYVIGEATNTAQGYGYDVVTMMQETKATLCRIEPAREA